MKQVFEQYASAIIAVLLATTLFAVMWGGSFFQRTGISQVLGQIMGYSIGANHVMKNDNLEEYKNQAAPVMKERNPYIVAEQPALLSDCFEAKSYQDRALPVFLKQIWDISGKEVKVDVSKEGTTICVAEAGIYWVQIYAIDENGKQSTKIAKLLVNER